MQQRQIDAMWNAAQKIAELAMVTDDGDTRSALWLAYHAMNAQVFAAQNARKATEVAGDKPAALEG